MNDWYDSDMKYEVVLRDGEWPDFGLDMSKLITSDST